MSDGRTAADVGTAGDPVERVRAALLAAGHPDTIRAHPAGTRSAADAAAAIGCDVAQIAKSVAFRAGDGGAVVVVASGADRVDRARVAALLGVPVRAADPAWVAEATGYAPGGVPPLPHAPATRVVVEETLFAHERVWAAAGGPTHVFETTAAELLRMTGGVRASVRVEVAPVG